MKIKNQLLLLLTLSFAVLSASCASTGFTSGTGNGSLFISVTEPVSNSAASTGLKKGEACSVNILGLISIGDASIVAARSNGNITKVATVDKKYFNVLLLFGQFCSVVTGE